MAYVLEKQFEHYLPEIDLFRQINDTEDYPDYTVCYVAGSLCQILVHWYEKGMDLPIDEISTVVEGIITGRAFETQYE